MNDPQSPANIRPVSSSEKFEIPFDTVDLPSRGLAYPKDSYLHGKTELEVHYLTAIHEDILTSPNLIKSGKMVPTLLKSVIKDKNFDPDELILGDRNTILIWLRSTGYGSEYPIQVMCSNCGTKFKYEFDLASLDIATLEESAGDDGLFSYDFPITKKTVKFKFMTAKEEDRISETVLDRRKKLNSKIDNTMSMRMVEVIRSIDGNTDREYIRNFINCLPIKDAHAFRKYYQELEPGVIMKQECTCTNCDNSEEVDVPILANFFWPEF